MSNLPHFKQKLGDVAEEANETLQEYFLWKDIPERVWWLIGELIFNHQEGYIHEGEQNMEGIEADLKWLALELD